MQDIERSLSSTSTGTDAYRFVLSHDLDIDHLEGIVAKARDLRVTPQRVMFAEGWLTADNYVQALAHQLGVPVLRAGDRQASAADVLIDATGQAPWLVAAAVHSARAIGRAPVLFAAARDRDVSHDEFLAAGIVNHAVEALRADTPAYSAGCRMWLWQYVFFGLLLGALLGGLFAAPDVTGQTALLCSAAIFAGVAAFRVLLLLVSLLEGRPNRPRNQPTAISDQDLPTYSVLVPLYQEAAILPDLIEALSGLDYPRAKLDVVLILEETDTATRGAAAETTRPPHMRIIVVPDRHPRTKPKALNMALALSRGDLVAVFDAEDVPDRDQLRKAAAMFAAAPGRYACLQARLAIYNPRQSWLSRHFALEYAALFHSILPALVRLGLPFPLSGTSNHFPRAALEAAAWDPFNVTEDADLGVRLSRSGGELGLIDTETQEEAPFTFRQWLPQRTRWIKGWMQTYLVHTRRPWKLLRVLGLWSTIGFYAVFAGFLISVLAYPFLFILLGLELTRPVPFAHPAGSLEHIALATALADLAIGVLASLAILLVGARRAGIGRLAGHILTAPLYWLLISAAGYRALIQVIWRPHYWEKTEHSPRRGRIGRRGRERMPRAQTERV